MRHLTRIILVVSAAGAIVDAASAADLPARIYTKTPVAAPFTWTGSYVGLYVGGASASGNAVTTDPVSPAGIPYNGVAPVAYGLDASFIAGYTGGYNYQFAPNWVVGYEGEMGYMRFRGSAIMNPLPAGNSDTTASTGIGDWYSAYTARLGYAVDRSLIYLKGGLAIARIETGVLDVTPAPTLDTMSHKWRAGYAVGGGWEYAFDAKWSLKAEYLYLGIENNFATFGVPSGFVVADSSTTRIPGIHTGKIGLNYKWDWFGMLR
jgi:outer membrane immunogenic protein